MKDKALKSDSHSLKGFLISFIDISSEVQVILVKVLIFGPNIYNTVTKPSTSYGYLYTGAGAAQQITYGRGHISNSHLPLMDHQLCMLLTSAVLDVQIHHSYHNMICICKHDKDNTPIHISRYR